MGTMDGHGPVFVEDALEKVNKVSCPFAVVNPESTI